MKVVVYLNVLLLILLTGCGISKDLYEQSQSSLKNCQTEHEELTKRIAQLEKRLYDGKNITDVVTINDVEFAFKECVREGANVKCTFEATNLNVDKKIQFFRNNQYFMDTNDGKRHYAEVINIGDNTFSLRMIHNNTYQGYVNFKGVKLEATKINTLQIGYDEGRHLGRLKNLDIKNKE